MEAIAGIFTLLGVIITAIIAQTIAVWTKFDTLGHKINESKCPFGKCPLYERARGEAAEDRNLVKEK